MKHYKSIFSCDDNKRSQKFNLIGQGMYLDKVLTVPFGYYDKEEDENKYIKEQKDMELLKENIYDDYMDIDKI